MFISTETIYMKISSHQAQLQTVKGKKTLYMINSNQVAETSSEGQLAQLGFHISCCLRNMDSYCYGLVKGVSFRAKVCFYRNKINAMSIPNRNPEIHDKIILKMLSRI